MNCKCKLSSTITNFAGLQFHFTGKDLIYLWTVATIGLFFLLSYYTRSKTKFYEITMQFFNWNFGILWFKYVKASWHDSIQYSIMFYLSSLLKNYRVSVSPRSGKEPAMKILELACFLFVWTKAEADLRPLQHRYL